MVNPIEESRITNFDVEKMVITIDVTNTYAIPCALLRKFAKDGLISIDVEKFSKTIQGEAFLSVNQDAGWDLLLVNRIAGNKLDVRGVNGYDGYILTVNGKTVAKFTSVRCMTNAYYVKANKDAILSTLKMRSIKFDSSEIELDELKRKLFC